MKFGGNIVYFILFLTALVLVQRCTSKSSEEKFLAIETVEYLLSFQVKRSFNCLMIKSGTALFTTGFATFCLTYDVCRVLQSDYSQINKALLRLLLSINPM